MNPQIWKHVPLLWRPISDDIHLSKLEIFQARDYYEIELMLDFDDNLWWRRHLQDDDRFYLGL